MTVEAARIPNKPVASHRFDNALRYRAEDHPSQTQFTPSYVVDLVRVDLGGVIWLDPCTTADNPIGADLFYTPSEDGLSAAWDSSANLWSRLPVFVNPPYGKAREPWVERCIEAGGRGQPVILLMPAATDTRIFQRAVATSAAIVFVRGRLKFGVLRPNRRQVAASHPSVLIGWNTDGNWPFVVETAARFLRRLGALLAWRDDGREEGHGRDREPAAGSSDAGGAGRDEAGVADSGRSDGGSAESGEEAELARAGGERP